LGYCRIAAGYKNAHDNLPNAVNTHAHRSYKKGVARTITRAVQDLAKRGINKPHANNNKIERLNSTLRERVKVQRGWKSKKRPFAEGQRIHYNFVKPHMTFEVNKAHAQNAGEDVKGWKKLSENAIERRENQLKSSL
jgi:hypothetical protein